MAIETRVRSTGQQSGAGGSSSSNSGGLAGTGGFYVFHTQSNPTVFPFSKVLVQGGNVTITTNATQVIIAANTGGASNSAGLLGTGGFFILGSANAQMPNSYVIQAGSSVSLNYTGTNLFISALTGGAASNSAGLAGTGAYFWIASGNASLPNAIATSSLNFGFLSILPQQTKLYANDSAARIDAGTPTWRLLFSPTTQQYGVWQFLMPQDYGTSPYLRLLWSSDSSLSVAKSAQWVSDVWGQPAGQTSPSIYVDTYGGTNASTVALSAGYSAGLIQTITIPLATVVSWGAGNFIKIRLSSSAGNVTGNQELIGLNLEYLKR